MKRDARVGDQIAGWLEELGRKSDDPEALAEWAGEVLETSGRALVVMPRSEMFSGARINRAQDGTVDYVELELAPEERVELAALAAMFGSSRLAARLHFDMPVRHVFRKEIDGIAYRVFAEEETREPGSSVTRFLLCCDGPTTELDLRR